MQLTHSLSELGYQITISQCLSRFIVCTSRATYQLDAPFWAWVILAIAVTILVLAIVRGVWSLVKYTISQAWTRIVVAFLFIQASRANNCKWDATLQAQQSNSNSN